MMKSKVLILLAAGLLLVVTDVVFYLPSKSHISHTLHVSLPLQFSNHSAMRLSLPISTGGDLLRNTSKATKSYTVKDTHDWTKSSGGVSYNLKSIPQNVIISTTNKLTLSTRGNLPGRRFMLALHIAEQLTMSTSHFVEFLNLVHQWNFTGVEPVIYRSRMFALRSMHSRDINGSLYYHQLLNTSHMRDKLSECFGQLDGTGPASNASVLFLSLIHI